jgi:hypothetical protein
MWLNFHQNISTSSRVIEMSHWPKSNCFFRSFGLTVLRLKVLGPFIEANCNRSVEISSQNVATKRYILKKSIHSGGGLMVILRYFIDLNQKHLLRKCDYYLLLVCSFLHTYGKEMVNLAWQYAMIFLMGPIIFCIKK